MVNDAFTPSIMKVEQARLLVETFDDALERGSGVVRDEKGAMGQWTTKRLFGPLDGSSARAPSVRLVSFVCYKCGRPPSWHAIDC